MQALGRRYVQHYNLKYSRSGTLWEGRYRATVIDSEEYFLMCSRYIEQNPVRAGIACSPSEYRWSSYRCNALGRFDPLISPGDVYLRLGRSPTERQKAYREFLRESTSAEALAVIRSATSGGWALGGESFGAMVQRLAGRRPFPIKRGRPRKIRV